MDRVRLLCVHLCGKVSVPSAVLVAMYASIRMCIVTTIVVSRECSFIKNLVPTYQAQRSSSGNNRLKPNTESGTFMTSSPKAKWMMIVTIAVDSHSKKNIEMM